jgi:anti-sigma factor RsiW
MRRAVYRLRFWRDHRWVPAHASDYLDGDLRPRECARAERHADECPECGELLRSLRAIVSALGTMRGEDGEVVAGEVLASVQSRLDELPRDDA